ncbi:MAG: DUF2087 domain-containing protein [Proteobacteria bacterium]|nr:DUF2087 domain-containing protein [Pseudomonadota bacterium]
MSRTLVALHVSDLSTLAKALRKQLALHNAVPSHLELLNMLAKSAGLRNYQHLKATAAAGPQAEPAPVLRPATETEPPVDQVLIRKLLRYFDAQGQLVRWPSKQSHQDHCLWVLWARFPTRQKMSEREVSAALNGLHLFGDPAILRRTMAENGLLSRKPDGSDYRRIEQKPPAIAAALIREVQAGGGQAR